MKPVVTLHDEKGEFCGYVFSDAIESIVRSNQNPEQTIITIKNPPDPRSSFYITYRDFDLVFCQLFGTSAGVIYG